MKINIDQLFYFVPPSDGEVVVIEPRVTREEIIEQLKQDIEEFYASVRRRYLALRRKHVRELKELRRLTNDSRGTGNDIKRCKNC